MFKIKIGLELISGKKCALLCLLVLIFHVSFLPAEEACKFSYKGIPEDLNDSTIVLPEKVIALSEYILVGMPLDSIIEQKINSIMFIIDNSGSMQNVGGNDQWGSRFVVARDLIDTIYNMNPKMQVGLVVFRTYLYFDPSDDPIFEQCPAYDTGAYIPLLTLDSTYNGQTGYDILKNYLETDTVSLDSLWIDLVYRPTNVILAGGNTNITASFEAAKQGMLSSIYPKGNHYIIFLSDGESTVGGNDYILGENVPTTYTVFFTPLGKPPQSLLDMTANIQCNGYSTSNSYSNLWAIETDYDTLMSLLMEKVIGQMVSQIYKTIPTNMSINGIAPVTGWDGTGFTFGQIFPLQGVTTDFNFGIDYEIYMESITENGDTITIKIADTTHNITFTVAIEDGAPVPDSVELTCWGRRLEFYHNDSLFEIADETMDSLEIRFSEVEVDMLYGYDSVFIELTNIIGTQTDKENFTLLNNGSYFTYTFPRAIDSIPTAGDGILQHQEIDNIIALFRNPNLLLDTLRVLVPFMKSSEINSSNFFSGKFNFRIVKSGARQHILKVNNLPCLGKISFYTINGRKILEQSLNKGNSSLSLPKTLSQAVYLMRLEYGNNILSRKILLQ